MAVFGSPATTTPATVPVQSCATITKVLQIGSKGEEVIKLQKFLGVETTGYFGALTQKKLIQWQISKRVITSAKTVGAGTTGPKTRATMKCAAIPETFKSSVSSEVVTKPAVLPIATTSSPAVPSTVPAAQSSGGGGGGSSYVSPYGYTCTPPGLQPAADSCATGSWQLSADEAGCAIWACTDSDDRG